MSTIQQFNFDLDLLRVIPWEKDNAPNLVALLKHKAEWYKKNYSEFWVSWERDVFNLNTANEFGLNVWSIILDLPLYTNPNASPASYPAFGFGPYGKNFDNGNFATSGDISSTLTTEEKRTLLLLRWLSLVSGGSMSHINSSMFQVFKGEVYCLDNLDMTLIYIFSKNPGELMFSLFREYDILPRPSGVELRLLISPQKSFGFGPYGQPFDLEYSQFGRES